jgi:hypothetical protein
MATLQRTDEDQERSLRMALMRLNAQAWGMSFGAIFGLGLFLATLFLVIRGGEHVGAHLSLLRVYFPGYSVSVAGSFIGFIYAFVVGYATGRLIGLIYNRLTDAVTG